MSVFLLAAWRLERSGREEKALGVLLTLSQQISRCSRASGRNVKNVSDDLKYLAELGLVSLDRKSVV